MSNSHDRPVSSTVIQTLIRAVSIIILILVTGLVGMPEGTIAQTGSPLLRVYAEQALAAPGATVSFTVMVNGTGGRTQIDVLFPNDLAISEEVECVHSPLYCTGWSIEDENQSTSRLTVTAPGNVPAQDGLTGGTQVTVTFSLTLPIDAVAGRQISVITKVSGLVEVLDPFSSTNNRNLTIVEVVTATGQRVPPPLHAERAGAAIQVTKKRCAGRDSFPVFVESHCADVPEAAFVLWNPSSTFAEVLSNGEVFVPDEVHFAGSNLWNLEDLASGTTARGTSVVSCVERSPESSWHSSVQNPIQTGDSAADPGPVTLDWTLAGTGVASQSYQPSIDCVWLELPDIEAIPAVLNLQVFESETPYLNWTENTGALLPEMVRGSSGDDLEASMVMTNTVTDEQYSFAADAYGQVLVPAATYSLSETSSRAEQYFSMSSGQTILVEVGLSGASSLAGVPSAPVETGLFATGALYCDAANCTHLEGVTILYESQDGRISGSCITAVIQGPNGTAAWCAYEFIVGMPTTLTLDESTLSPGWVLVSENPQSYLVPENPDGPLGPVYFEVVPV